MEPRRRPSQRKEAADYYAFAEILFRRRFPFDLFQSIARPAPVSALLRNLTFSQKRLQFGTIRSDTHRVRILPLLLLLGCAGAVPRSGPSYLGVLYQETRQGVEIVQIMPNSPAIQAGLGIGDTIVAVDGHRVGRSASLRSAILERTPGTRLKLTVLRASGERHDVEAVVDALPAQFRK